MKILVTPTSFLKPENAEARALLEGFADEVAYNDLGVPLQGEELLRRLDGADGCIAGLDHFTADVVRAAPVSLRVISRYGAGVDRVDLDACRERGIVVANTPGANATAVCELAIGLMLAVARDIPALHQAVGRGEWPRACGVELAGKTLGIVGLGTIGKKLAVRARAMEMAVQAFDPYIDRDFALRHGIAEAGLDELLRTSDVVSLHAPLTPQTRHMLDAARFREMRDGAIVINTARGGLIDEEAAAQALRAGKLRGLGLDAFEQEPPRDSPLLGLPGVVFTPHTGAHTAEAVRAMGVTAVRNLIGVLTGEGCPYIVR
ncbi:MAG TPA: phosphoglycerate dehydrogenase [Candidatus Limnocylindria bacterium]|nr:phosphoglycerate dehydrogenase [Candidatus Limnocylindria bacterium]